MSGKQHAMVTMTERGRMLYQIFTRIFGTRNITALPEAVERDRITQSVGAGPNAML